MPTYLTERDGWYRFNRRVPEQYEKLDPRGFVKASLRIRVTGNGEELAEAQRKANAMNSALERYWSDLERGDAQAIATYHAALSACRKMKMSEPIADSSQRTIEELLKRMSLLEAALANRSLLAEAEKRPAILATFDAVQRPAVTFRQDADHFIEGNAAKWGVKHLKQWTDTLATYVYPTLGDVDVSKINNGDGTKLVLDVLRPIWNPKPATAQRVRGRIESILDYAKAMGHREGENPARWRGHLDKILPSTNGKVENRPAMDWHEVPALMQKLQADSRTVARCLELVILTACRSGEVREAKWSEINGRLWTIPASRMKAGKEHRVPLTDAMLAVLARLPRKGEYVFPGRGDTPITHSLMPKLVDAIAPQATAHGFRSTFRDWAGDNQQDRELAEMALAHAIGNEVENAYKRTDLLERRRAMMQAWSGYCYSA